MIPVKEYIEGPEGLPSLIPYFRFVKEGVVQSHNNTLTACFYYSGPDMSSSLGQEEDSLAKHVHNVFLNFGTGWTVQCDIIRVSAKEYMAENNFNNTLSLLIEEKRREAYEKEEDHRENTYCMSVTFQPGFSENKKLKKFLLENAEHLSAHQTDQTAAVFEKKLDEMESYLSTRLSIKRMTSEEMMTFFNKCISGKSQTVPLPEIPINIEYLLGCHEFITGYYPKIDEQYIGVVTLTKFPLRNYSGILNFLNTLPFEYRLSSRFIFRDVQHTLQLLKRQLNKFELMKYSGMQYIASIFGVDLDESKAKNVSAMNKAAEVLTVKEAVEMGEYNCGYYTGTIIFFDEDKGRCIEKTQYVRKILNEFSFQAIIETINTTEGYLGSLPGETIKNVRKPIITTRNFSNMIALTDIWSGQETNPCAYYPEQSPPLFYAATTGNTPFRFNLHVGDVGHTLILGPTGSGKSVLISHIANSALRYKDAQIYIIDSGYSQYALTKAVGGKYYDILGEDSDLSFCPLADIEDPNEQIWASEWIEQIIKLQGVIVDPEIRNGIAEAIRDMAKSERKTLTDFYVNIQNQEVKNALEPFVQVHKGFMSTLLDAEKDSFQKNNWQVFEMSKLLSMDQRQSTPVLLYIFHKIIKSLDGRPTFIIIDEGWVAMLNELFMEYWIEFLRTARKKNAAVIFATQSLADIAESKYMQIIKESCLTKIYLPNSSAREEGSKKLYEEFGMNERQIEIITQAIMKKEYYVTARGYGERLIDLGLSKLELAFYGVGSEIDRKKINLLEKKYQDQWVFHWLQEKGLIDEAKDWAYLNNERGRG